MIPIKSEQDLETMRQAGKILARIVNKLQEVIKPDITTKFIDDLTNELFIEANVKTAFKGYRGYPAHVCASINEVVVHGIPSGRKLKSGDILGLDLGLEYEGFFSDMTITLPVGKVDGNAKRLIEIAKNSLAEGIKKVQPGNHLSDVSYAIQSYVERHGYSIVRQFVGHGIGSKMHEEPEVANFGKPGKGPILKPGMVLAIEPMVNMGGWECEILEDGWTAVTVDGSLSAHFEHTVAVTENGAEILTKI